MRILEEFWYGNVEPTEYETASCKEYKKLQELICRNEEKLKAAMTDEQKELIEKYTDCVREYQMAVAPDRAEQVVYDVLMLDGFAVGETTFVLDGISYTYRTAATPEITADFADISGLTTPHPVNESTAVSYCDARLSYEDGGNGKIVWFDPVPGLLYSLSMVLGNMPSRSHASIRPYRAAQLLVDAIES